MNSPLAGLFWLGDTPHFAGHELDDHHRDSEWLIGHLDTSAPRDLLLSSHAAAPGLDERRHSRTQDSSGCVASVAGRSIAPSILRHVTVTSDSAHWRAGPGSGVRAHSSRRAGRTLPAPAAWRRTILYIGVDPDCRIVLTRIVRRMAGVHLAVTCTGREGRLLAVSLTPGLILLDTHLPACDAHELLVYLGRSAFTSTIPLAVVSGDEGDRLRFLRGGAAAWITKPLNIAEVERATMGLLELASSR